MNMKKILLATIIFGLSAQVNAATVNLNAKLTTLSNAVVLNLTAGTYNVSPFAGTYTAWNAWNNTEGCTNGDDCSVGWINNYSIMTPTETINIFTSSTYKYQTQQLALLSALSTTFTLSSDSAVKFFISDSNYGDNAGGMSLNVSPVPIPAAALLFAPALLGFMGLRRKAKNSVA